MRSILAALAISISILGCASDVSTEPTFTPSPRPQPLPTGACALITETEAATLLGHESSVGQSNPGRVGTTQCTFFAGESGAGQDSGVDKVIVGVDVSPTAKERFESAKTAPAAMPISGLGDDAFYETGATGNVTVTVLTGDATVFISVGGSKTVYTPDQSAAILEAVKILIADVLTRA